MIREEIERGFLAVGWKIADRSSQHLLVGHSGDLTILAYEFLTRTEEDPAFMLIDNQRILACWVSMVPTPRIAAVLLGEHGEPLAG